MRICIPTETNAGLKAKVNAHFGSANYFTIYDTEKESVETLDNTNMHHAHGTCQPMKMLGARSIDVVVCSGMGARAIQGLNAVGIKALRAEASTVEEVIKKLNDKKLVEITVENACVQHGCH